MRRDRELQCQKYSTVLGSALILFSSGVYWYWGNMSVYCKSFLLNVVNAPPQDVDTPWTISVFLIFWTLGTVISGSVAKTIGRRWTVLLGAIVINVGTFSGYFSVQNSVMTLTLSVGVAMGLGAGLSDSSILQIILEWADNKDAGTLTSVVQGSMCFGGFIINQLITFYINPRNVIPDLNRGTTTYFTQQEVLDKVPTMFLVIGGLTAGLQVIGFFLLHRKPKDEIIIFAQKEEGEESALCSHRESKARTYNKNRPLDLDTSSSIDTLTKADSSDCDYSPRGMMKTTHFYAFWMTSFLGDLSFLMITNYYKVFGQLWIKDDHFLTSLGSALVLSNAAVSLLWGKGMDAFGVKRCFVVFMASSSILQVWYYYGPMANRWIHALGTVLLGCSSGALITCYTAAIALVYGKTHFTTNYGIFMTSAVAMNIVAPFVMEAILVAMGWFELFAIIAACNFFRLLIVLFFIPQV